MMLKILFLLCLLGALVGFLLWRRTPRAILFGAIFFSTWIYGIGFWVSAGTLDRFSDNLSGGFIPYLAAIIPTALFLGWFLRGMKASRK